MTQGEWIVLNLVWGITLGTVLEYFWMSQETVIILGVVLVLDWIFGIVNAYMQWTLESKLMYTGLIKKLSRWLLPFIVIIVIKGAWFQDVNLVSSAIVSILIVAEWYSIIGHIYSINYKEQLAEIDALKLLLQWLAKILKWKVDETLPPKDLDGWNENTI